MYGFHVFLAFCNQYYPNTQMILNNQTITSLFPCYLRIVTSVVTELNISFTVGQVAKLNEPVMIQNEWGI